MDKKVIFKALSWNFIGIYGNQGILFAIGIILARILKPEDFGIIAIVLVFSSYGQILIDLGFSNAIIQDKSSSREDLSSVFYFNIAVGFLFFIILFFFSDHLADFYREERLNVITKLMSLLFIFYALTSIQRTLFIKRLDFKSETSIILISSVISGGVSIFLALRGSGVWALVVKVLLQKFLETILFWLKSRWRPVLVFNIKTLKKYFNFSLNMTGATLVNGFTQDIDRLIVGKVFSPGTLGFFDRSKRYNDIVRMNLGNMFGKVMFPVFSDIQNNSEKFMNIYRKSIKMICFLTMPLFFILTAVAEPLIVVLITEKWLPSAQILQVLSFSGFTYPLSAVMVKTLAAKGRADILFRLTTITAVLYVIAIFGGSRWGIFGVAAAITVVNFIGLLINSCAVCKLIKLSILTQFKDVLETVTISLIMLAILLFIPVCISLSNYLNLVILPAAGITIYGVISYFFNRKQIDELKSLLKEVFNHRKAKS